jgi:hypothetical protein
MSRFLKITLALALAAFLLVAPRHEATAANIWMCQGDVSGATAGTRTKDANPFRTLAGVVANAAFAAMLPEQTEVFRQQPGEWPIVLATGEGFVIEATVPATGTWTWGCDIDWDEVSSFGAAVLS